MMNEKRLRFLITPQLIEDLCETKTRLLLLFMLNSDNIMKGKNQFSVFLASTSNGFCVGCSSERAVYDKSVLMTSIF